MVNTLCTTSPASTEAVLEQVMAWAYELERNVTTADVTPPEEEPPPAEDRAAVAPQCSRAVSGDARVLSIKTNTIGVRERSWASVVEDMREEKVDSMPAPRTSKWCMHHVLKEGRGLEAHLEHLKTLCGLKHDQWGMEEYGSIIHILDALILVDQLDPTNTVGVEMAFRRLQTIEYAYPDRLRERMATGSTGRLTVDEQAAFGAAAKAESKLLICPALLESAKVDVERESALARALLKAREARVSLSRKDCK